MRTLYNVDKMYTYLRGFLIGANMRESLTALQFARRMHKNQTRKDGTPYIVHPLRMACYAIAIGIRDDNIVATVLLHDVVEDCGVEVDNLPAIIAKALDRYDNLCDMAGVLAEKDIIKNIKETRELLLPVLKEAKEKWVDLADVLFVLRTNIRNITDTLAAMYILEEEKIEEA